MPAIINDALRQKLISELKEAVNATFTLKFYDYSDTVSKRTPLDTFSLLEAKGEIILPPENIYYAIKKSSTELDESAINIGGVDYYYAASIADSKDSLWNCLFFKINIETTISDYNTVVVTYHTTASDKVILMAETLPVVKTIEALESFNGLIKF